VIARKMLAGADADPGPAYVYAEVIRHERRSKDIATMTVSPLHPLEFRAGQYVSVECPKYQPRVWRTYSMANAPRSDGTIDFHVRALGAGWLSGALVRRTRVRDMLRIAAPMGSMAVDRRSTRDVVCVAGGTGLAPIKSIIEELATYNRTRWVHVFFGARDREDLYDMPDLQRLAAAYPWLSLMPVCSHDSGWGGEEGLLSEVVRRYGPWQDHDFFVSGSPAMVRACLRTLNELQVPPMRVKYDAFSDF
jgi:NAD(P)H-flavin reductase